MGSEMCIRDSPRVGVLSMDAYHLRNEVLKATKLNHLKGKGDGRPHLYMTVGRISRNRFPLLLLSLFPASDPPPAMTSEGPPTPSLTPSLPPPRPPGDH